MVVRSARFIQLHFGFRVRKRSAAAVGIRKDGGAGGADDRAQQRGPMTLLAIRSLSQSDVPAGVIVAFIHAVSDHLWRSLIVCCDFPPFKPPDRGLREVKADDAFSANPKLSTPPSNSCVTFNFVGEVTRTPSKGALPLCEVFGTKIYVQAGGFKTLSNEAFVPAWIVGVDAKNPTMAVHTRQEEFIFKYTNVKQLCTVKPMLTIHYLQLDAKTKGKDDKTTPVVLTRPSIEIQVNSAAAAAAPRNGKVKPLLDPKWKHCRHLFK